MRRTFSFLAATLASLALTPAHSAEPQRLALTWEKNDLTIRGDFPGGELRILYLEAYCRPGSTDRDLTL